MTSILAIYPARGSFAPGDRLCRHKTYFSGFPMAKTYTSTIELRCWKEHACVGCGGLYASELVRKVSGTGGTAEKAEINARAAVQRAINTATDLQPCPTCGL